MSHAVFTHIARYQDGEQLEIDSRKSPFEQYVFFGDDKLAYAGRFAKDDKIEINLQGLYPDVDVAENLSNLLGKAIRRLDENQPTARLKRSTPKP